jgi:hypothetical protein
MLVGAVSVMGRDVGHSLASERSGPWIPAAVERLARSVPVLRWLSAASIASALVDRGALSFAHVCTIARACRAVGRAAAPCGLPLLADCAPSGWAAFSSARGFEHLETEMELRSTPTLLGPPPHVIRIVGRAPA